MIASKSRFPENIQLVPIHSRSVPVPFLRPWLRGRKMDDHSHYRACHSHWLGSAHLHLPLTPETSLVMSVRCNFQRASRGENRQPFWPPSSQPLSFTSSITTMARCLPDTALQMTATPQLGEGHWPISCRSLKTTQRRRTPQDEEPHHSTQLRAHPREAVAAAHTKGC